MFNRKFRQTVRTSKRHDPASSRTDEHSNVTSNPDLVHTVECALAHVSQPQPLQVGRSNLSEASQQVFREALPPVLVLHLRCFPYHDATADCIVRINKPIQFAPKLYSVACSLPKDETTQRSSQMLAAQLLYEPLRRTMLLWVNFPLSNLQCHSSVTLLGPDSIVN
ncbi:hypothetical protein BGY98DRAFT_169896 [Russula aff. rugulosa BPL654]|nr:hypothetical protein BGY98DRAFT_169896 [Russula aff. rugulosa BPL654]